VCALRHPVSGPPHRRPDSRQSAEGTAGGRQVLLADPDGNLVELFQAAHRPGTAAAAAP
jgi:hypothetical protein